LLAIIKILQWQCYIFLLVMYFIQYWGMLTFMILEEHIIRHGRVFLANALYVTANKVVLICIYTGLCSEALVFMYLLKTSISLPNK
jgi:hypothetical protein